MQRYLKLTVLILCLTLALSSVLAVKKGGKNKSKPKAQAEETKPEEVKPVIPQEEILAEFNGGIITKTDLKDKIAKLPPQNQARFKTVEGQAQMLDIMITEEVFWLKAKEMNVPNESAVKDKINAARKQALSQEYYKRNVNGKVTLTEAEKQDYYRENLKDFYQAPIIEINYIQPADEEAGRKAILALRRGTPVADVSSEYSINTYGKSVKGKIKNIRGNGYIPGVGNDAALDSLILAAEVDTVNFMGPVKTATGWHVFQVTTKTPGMQRPYLECEPEVDQRLRPKKEAELLKQIMDRLKKEYNVVIDTLALSAMNLREPDKNRDMEDIVAVTSTEPTLGMTVGQVQEKFMRLSPQEQMIYAKQGSAIQLVEQELSRNLMALDGMKDKELQNYLDTNEEFKQSMRYYVLQEAYKKLVLDSLSITPEDMRSYYDSHLQEFTTPSARKVTAVWVKDDKTAKKVRKLLVKALKKNKEEAIAAIVKKYNLKPQQETLDNNYKNGIVTSIGADQKLSDVIWNTPVGTISEVAKTVRNDTVIFRILEERDPVTKSYTEVEARIQNNLRKERATARMEDVKQQLNTAYNLKKYPEKLEIKLSADELFELADGAARQRKFKDATIYYDQIIKFYPNGNDDYKASFMKAFLVSEDIGDKEQGLMLFKEFLKKYPAGELNESAQFMIDELEGKHPQFEEVEPVKE